MRRERNLMVWMTTASLALLLAVPVSAQEGQGMPELTPEEQAEMEAYMKAGTPGPQHAELAKEVGTYHVATKSWNDPSKPPMEMTGTATRTMMFDGRIMVETFEGSFMGMPFTGQGMTGYDNVAGKYWSTWMDSMSTGLMLSEGTCKPDRSCVYVGTYNDPIKNGPVTAKFKMWWTDEKTQMFEMHAPGRDGKEMKMMEMTYTKQ